MKLTYLRHPYRFIEDYFRVQQIKTILLEDKDYLKLLNEALGHLFLAKFPIFAPDNKQDRDIASDIIARLHLIMNDQIAAGKGVNLNTKDITEVIRTELMRNKVRETEANKLATDEMVIKNFREGFLERPEWVRIEKRVREITGRPEMVPKGPLKHRQIGLTYDPMADSGAGSAR